MMSKFLTKSDKKLVDVTKPKEKIEERYESPLYNEPSKAINEPQRCLDLDFEKPSTNASKEQILADPVFEKKESM